MANLGLQKRGKTIRLFTYKGISPSDSSVETLISPNLKQSTIINKPNSPYSYHNLLRI